MCLLGPSPIPQAYPIWPLDNQGEELSVLPFLKNFSEAFAMEFVRSAMQSKRNSMIHKVVAQGTHFVVCSRAYLVSKQMYEKFL